MADPLTVSASAVGIIALGLTVSSSLLDYYSAFKDQRSDVAEMLRSLQTLSKIFEAINRKVQDPLLNREAVDLVTDSLMSCRDCVHRLQAKLDKIRNTKPCVRIHVQRATYPFQKKTLDKLKWMISVVQDHLNLAISALQLDVSITLRGRLDDLGANVGSHHAEQLDRFARLDLGQEQEKLRARGSDEEKVLTWLSQLEFYSKQDDARSRCQEGTGQWFLESAEFNSWVSTDARVLWCPGIPGAGKTVLSSIVIEHLQAQYRPSEKIGIAFVYCAYDRADYTASRLLASLLKQLALQSDTFLEDIASCHKGHSRFGTPPNSKELSHLLGLQVQRFDEVFIIVDALDECPEADNNRTAFISGVRGLLPKIHATDQDVKLFIESHIDQQAELSDLLEDHEDVRSMISATVVEKSNGMFLIAVLHMDSLGKEDNLRDLKEALQHLPEDLDKTYGEAMSRINRQDSRRLARAHQVLKLISCAKRPLKLTEMRQALSVRTTDTFLDPEALPKAEAVISTCCGIVVVEEESQIVRLVHYTTEEYFIRKQQHFRSSEAHRYFCGILIIYLGFTRFSSFALEGEMTRAYKRDSRGVATLLTRLENLRQENDLVVYGAENWGYHARQALSHLEDNTSEGSRDLEQLIAQYLQKVQNIEYANRILIGIEQERANKFAWEFYHTNRFVLDTPSRNRATSLYAAATHGIYPSVKHYLDHGVDVNASGARGKTALHGAARYGHADIVKLLLDHGAAIEIQDVESQNALLWAVHENRLPVARLLLEKGSDPCVMATNMFGNSISALSLAAELGYETMLELLIEYGAHTADIRQLLGDALIEAAAYGRDSVVRLLTGGAKIWKIPREDLTCAIAYAATRGQDKPVAVLLNAGVELPLSKASLQPVAAHRRFRGVLGGWEGAEKPLIHWVVFAGHCDVLALLLEQGADVNTLNPDGNTALVALAQRHHRWSFPTNDVPVVQQLLEAGTDTTATDSDCNRTSLQWALLTGKEDMVQLLLDRESLGSASRDRILYLTRIYRLVLNHERKVQFDSVTGDNNDDKLDRLLLEKEAMNLASMVHLLYIYVPARAGCLSVVETFCEWGAALNSACEYGQTALLQAVGHGHKEIAQYLIGKGADIGVVDYFGDTPLTTAAKFSMADIVERLLTRANTMGCTPAKQVLVQATFQAINSSKTSTVEILLRFGGAAYASFSSDEHQGTTFLHSVTWSRLPRSLVVPMFDTLLQHGADMEAKDKDGNTPLMAAVLEYHFEDAECLLQRGADLNAKNNSKSKRNETALVTAVRRGIFSVVKFLLDKGADPHALTRTVAAKLQKQTQEDIYKRGRFGLRVEDVQKSLRLVLDAQAESTPLEVLRDTTTDGRRE
ncbi:MAG: hypothetical protein Q9185_006186 [Variospora sp. 1 TL-2023]